MIFYYLDGRETRVNLLKPSDDLDPGYSRNHSCSIHTLTESLVPQSFYQLQTPRKMASVIKSGLVGGLRAVDFIITLAFLQKPPVARFQSPLWKCRLCHDHAKNLCQTRQRDIGLTTDTSVIPLETPWLPNSISSPPSRGRTLSRTSPWPTSFPERYIRQSQPPLDRKLTRCRISQCLSAKNLHSARSCGNSPRKPVNAPSDFMARRSFETW